MEPSQTMDGWASHELTAPGSVLSPGAVWREPLQISNRVAPTGTNASVDGYCCTPTIHHPQLMMSAKAIRLNRFRIHCAILSRGIHTARRPPAIGSQQRAMVS